MGNHEGYVDWLWAEVRQDLDQRLAFQVMTHAGQRRLDQTETREASRLMGLYAVDVKRAG